MRPSLIQILILSAIAGVCLLFATFVLLRKTGEYIVIIAAVSYVYSLIILPYMIASTCQTHYCDRLCQKTHSSNRRDDFNLVELAPTAPLNPADSADLEENKSEGNQPEIFHVDLNDDPAMVSHSMSYEEDEGNNPTAIEEEEEEEVEAPASAPEHATRRIKSIERSFRKDQEKNKNKNKNKRRNNEKKKKSNIEEITL